MSEMAIIWRVERWDGISIFCESESDAKKYVKTGNETGLDKENIFPMTAKDVARVLYMAMNHPDDIRDDFKTSKESE